MIELNGDLKVVAKIKKDGKEYELREVSIDDLQKINEMEDKNEALFWIFEKGGLPKEVSKSLSVSVLQQLEKALIGETGAKK